MDHIEFVLAPLDFSEKCRIGLRAAIFFARKLGVPLELLHIDPRIMSDAEEVMLRVSYQEYEKKERQFADDAARRMSAMLQEEGGGDLDPPPVFTVLGGDPAEAIARHADDPEDCVIVLTKKSCSGVADLLLGSVTQKVVRHARVPVITVHSEVDCLEENG